jgi:L-glyceraldehyde 3-phosphate reductase
MGALDAAVRAGKALYVGISSYSSQRTHQAAKILRELGTPAVIHQPSYAILNRWTEEDQLLDATDSEGMGVIAFSPLAQGLLTDKYLKGVPAGSRASSGAGSWNKNFLSEKNMTAVAAFNKLAKKRGQTLAQMAIAWVLRDPRMTSALIGASRVEQIEDAVAALDNLAFSKAELAEIDKRTEDAGINLWKRSSTA